MERIEARIRRHELAMSRLERDILRLKKYFHSAGPSQISNKTQEVNAQPAPEIPPAPRPRPAPRPQAPPAPAPAPAPNPAGAPLLNSENTQ
jgi:hypothetical protein